MILPPLFLRSLLPCMALLGVALAGYAQPLPEPDAVRGQLQHLATQELPAAQAAELRSELELTLQWLEELADTQRRQQQLQQRLRDAPADSLRQQRALARFRDADPAALRADYQNRDLDNLNALLMETLSSQEALQQTLADTTSDIAAQQILPERVQAALASALQEQENARIELMQLSVRDDASAQQIVGDRLRTQIAALNARLELHRMEMQASAELKALASQRATLLQRQIDDHDARLSVLQDVLDAKRKAHTLAAIAASREQLTELPDTPVLQAQLATNNTLAERLLAVTSQVNEQLRMNVQLRSQLDKVRQLERSLTEQVSALQGSLLLSRLLFQQQRLLPQLARQPGGSLDIPALRLEQFQISGQRDALLQPQGLARQLLEEAGHADDAAAEAALINILQVRQELLQQLDPELTQLLSLAINGATLRQQLQTASRQSRATIEEQLLWMPSNRALTVPTLLEMPARFARQVAALWQHPTWRQALERVQARWPLILLAGLAALVLLARRPALRRRLAAIDEQIGFLRLDAQRNTPAALALNVLAVAPLPLVLGATGLVLRSGDTAGATLIGAAVMKLAMIALVFGLLWRLFRRDGVVIRHFRWPAENTRAMRRLLLLLGLAFVPLAAVIAVGEQTPQRLADDVIGLWVVLLAGPILAALMWRLVACYPSTPGVRLLRITVTAIALAPLLLTVLAALGYYYTAVRLGGRLVDSFYLLVLWLLCAATVRRGLTLAARRLAYRRALIRREELRLAKQAEPSDVPEAEEPPLDLALVNTQALRIAHLFLLLVFGVAIYWVWADLIGAMSYLDTITLWQQTVGTGEQAQLVRTSLGDVVFGLLFLIVALMMARNLPGLLEVAVLSRLALRPGSAYTITSLLAYIITAVGLVVAIGSLGVSWDKLQWLVAALGVGLGFGLQEIFGNFVAGIIVLFERPVRVGDLITLGNHTGTVTRIRIRATTVRDGDGKEVIIPNKAFVTDRLVNWSLTDTITRLVIQIGFAHGSDPELIRRLLLQAASENPRVMQTPAPQAIFTAFGSATQDHELRVHVSELADRTPAGDELNRRIDQLCREQGLRISYSQVDVHILNRAGDEIALQQSPASSSQANT